MRSIKEFQIQETTALRIPASHLHADSNSKNSGVFVSNRECRGLEANTGCEGDRLEPERGTSIAIFACE